MQVWQGVWLCHDDKDMMWHGRPLHKGMMMWLKYATQGKAFILDTIK